MDKSNQRPFTPKASVILVTRDGKYTKVSPAHALQFIEDWGLTGHGKNGLIKTVVAEGAPRPSPFAPLGTKRMFAADARENAPRTKPVLRNVHGALTWKWQPMSADSGRIARASNIQSPLSFDVVSALAEQQAERRLVR